jgi:hypothetical protein
MLRFVNQCTSKDQLLRFSLIVYGIIHIPRFTFNALVLYFFNVENIN